MVDGVDTGMILFIGFMFGISASGVLISGFIGLTSMAEFTGCATPATPVTKFSFNWSDDKILSGKSKTRINLPPLVAIVTLALVADISSKN
jgi:hypothetical protein